MKKVMRFILSLLLVTIFFISCSNFIVKNVYQQSFDNKKDAITTVNNKIIDYGVRSLPLNEWMDNYFIGDTVLIIQRIIRKPINKKSEYTFTFSEFLYPSDTTYTLLIRYSGKEKDMIRP